MNDTLKKMDKELHSIKKKVVNIKKLSNIDFGSDTIKRYKKILDNFEKTKTISDNLTFLTGNDRSEYYTKNSQNICQSDLGGQYMPSNDNDILINERGSYISKPGNNAIRSDGFRNIDKRACGSGSKKSDWEPDGDERNPIPIEKTKENYAIFGVSNLNRVDVNNNNNMSSKLDKKGIVLDFKSMKFKQNKVTDKFDKSNKNPHELKKIMDNHNRLD